jgi:hypothetical protein
LFRAGRAPSGLADSQFINFGGCWQRPDNGDVTQLTFVGLRSRTQITGCDAAQSHRNFAARTIGPRLK